MAVRRRLACAVTAALLGAAAACTDPDDEPGSPASPQPSPSPTASSTAPTAPTATPAPTGGPADAPAPVTPTTEILDWQPLPGSTEDTVTTNGDWTLTVPSGGRSYQLGGPEHGSGMVAEPNRRITDAFLDQRWALVVFSDELETEPARAEVTELESGDRFTIDVASDIPTIPSGPWALGAGSVGHATNSSAGEYCLTRVDLASRRSTLGWCAAPREGFSSARISEAGTAVMTFDDSQPSCRTVVEVTGTSVEPFPGVTECKGWEGVVMDDGAVWSVVPKENRIESAHLYARVGEDYFDLGPGTSGTLVPCGGAAYFVRDPQRDGEPARLMRWDGSALSVVYESPGGQAFLDVPRCGGATINVTAFAEAGDEHVWAEVGTGS